MNKLRGVVLGYIIYIIYRLISMTWRITLIEPPLMKSMLDEKKPFMLGHFHGDELVLLLTIRRYRVATITSTSKDGELMNTAVLLAGGKTSRGSSTRGSVSALKGLIKLCKNGNNSSFAVDGPKGPVFEVKPGIFEVVRLLGSPIFAGGTCADRAWHFPRSWNKTYLPKPFANVAICWTETNIQIDKSTDPRDPVLAKTLQNQLFDARRQSANLIAAKGAQS